MNQEMLQKEVPRIAEEFGLSEDDVREAIIVGRVLSFASASKRKVVDSPREDGPAKETRDALSRVVGEIYLAIARAIGIQGKALTIVEQYYLDMDVVEIEWEVETLGSALYHFMDGLACSLDELDYAAKKQGVSILPQHAAQARALRNVIDKLIDDDEEE